MGISPFKSNCSCEHETSLFKASGCDCQSISGNPDPRKFEIIATKKFNNYTVLMITYPDCTNYEGNKILVFENPIKNETFIDPHFCEKHQSPIARFEPTLRGLAWAIDFCEMLERKTK